MKRLFTTFALAMLVMLGASSAFAVTCTTTNLTGPTGYTGWPYTANVVGCTGTTLGNFELMQGGLYDMVHNYTVGTTGAGPALKTLAPNVFYFLDAADYASYMTGCPALDAHVFGETFFLPLTCAKTGNKAYSVVLDESDQSEGNAWLDNVAAHEMGHWFDEQVLGTVAAPFSGTTLWTDVMNVALTGTTGDYINFNALGAPCSGSNHPFGGRLDNHFSHKYICGSTETGTLVGTPHTGDIFTITVTDAALSPDPQPVSYTVLAADNTLAKIATKLAAKLEANTNLTSHHITATSAGAVVTITSASGNPTTYSENVTGGTESINLNSDGTGEGPGLSANYSGSNITIINAATAPFYSDPAELFAQEAAVNTLAVTPRVYTDAYMGQGTEWNCTQTVLKSELQYGVAPGPGQHYTVPTGCPAN